MATANQAVIDQLRRVVDKVLFLKRRSLFRFRDLELYPSEVHLMLLIHQRSERNATAIAERLGVTKGAVSQTLSRLEAKGVLRKEKDPKNRNELSLAFTPLGAEALEFYRRRVKEFDRQHARNLRRYSAAEKAAIHRFLIQVEGVIDQIE